MSALTHITKLYTPRRAVITLACLLVLGLASYIYLVQQAVVNAAEREQMEESVAELNSELGEMEFRHISLKRSVDLSYAREHGFQESTNAQYAIRGEARALTIRESR